MSECGLQDTPRDDLSFFHPTPRRHRRPGKEDNHYARNYTLKLPLSPIVTMHYAAVRNCRKRAVPGLQNECQGRLGGDPLRLARPPLLPAAGAVSVLSKGLRSHSGRPCLRVTTSSESEALRAQTVFARGQCLVVRYSRCELYESLRPKSRLVHSKARPGFRFPANEAHARRSPGECGSSV